MTPRGAKQMAPGRVEPKPGQRTIAITGISGSLGRLLTHYLFRDFNIIGFARKPYYGKPRGVEVYEGDLRKRAAEDVFRTHQIDTVIHLGLVRNPRVSQREHRAHNVHGTMRLLEYAVRYNVKKVILLSSANIYGPQPDNPLFIKEDAPLNAAQDFPEIRDLIEVDMFVQSFFWKYPQIETTILRPVNILGPTVRNAASNYLRLRLIPTLLGFDPMCQVVHEMDVVKAIAQALESGIKGIFNIVGPGEIPLSVVIRELGKPNIPLPHFAVEPLWDFFWRWNISSFPPHEWQYVKYSYTVDGKLAREQIGFQPEYTLAETVKSILQS